MHQNLAIVDNYIALCEKSVSEEPENEVARDYLYEAYQQKADLLDANDRTRRKRPMSTLTLFRRSGIPQVELASPLAYWFPACCSAAHFRRAPTAIEKHFKVDAHPVITIHNPNGRSP